MSLLRHIPGMKLLSPWWWIQRVALLIVAGYLALSAFVVWSASRPNADPSVADAIVVLGAAQYNGKPSPALERRLEHALALYKADKANLIVVTGGRQQGDRVTEATAAANFLIRNGVPDSHIKREVQGKNTYESLKAASRFLPNLGVRRVIVVTDGYHAARVSAIAREVGLDPEPSPVGGSGTLDRRLQETAAVAVGNLVGYRRLTAWLG